MKTIFQSLWIISILSFLWACTDYYQEEVSSIDNPVFTPTGQNRVVQRATSPCILQDESDQTCTDDAAAGVRRCRRPAWAVVLPEEQSTFLTASHFDGTESCDSLAASNGATCIPPKTLTPTLEQNQHGNLVFDCGSVTRDTRISDGLLINERFSFYDEVVAYVDAPADFLPSGNSLQCNGGLKVSGIDPATGDVICATDQIGTGDVTSVHGGTGLQGNCYSGACTISIASSGVTSAHIATGAVTGSDIANGTITGEDLAAGAFTMKSYFSDNGEENSYADFGPSRGFCFLTHVRVYSSTGYCIVQLYAPNSYWGVGGHAADCGMRCLTW